MQHPIFHSGGPRRYADGIPTELINKFYDLCEIAFNVIWNQCPTMGGIPGQLLFLNPEIVSLDIPFVPDQSISNWPDVLSYDQICDLQTDIYEFKIMYTVGGTLRRKGQITISLLEVNTYREENLVLID